MYELNQVVNGLMKYIEVELLNNMNSLTQFVGGMAMGRLQGNAVNVFNRYKDNEFVKMFNIVGEDDKIDVVGLSEQAREQIRKKPLTINLPIFGIVTFKEDDVNKLENYIRG